MLTLAEYEQRALRVNKLGEDAAARDRLRYGFFGEIGGLLSAVKKPHRETLAPMDVASAREELGDALWYFVNVVKQDGLTLEAVGSAMIAELQERLNIDTTTHTPAPHTFEEIDGLLTYRSAFVPKARDSLLYSLAAHTGDVFNQYPLHEVSNQPQSGLLPKLLADMAFVAARFDLSFADVAEANLRKIESRWPPTGTEAVRHFDTDFEPHEQLPRQLSIEFIERVQNGRKYAFQRWKGVNIGDRLTDNRTDADGYRFHDVFHLAYMAHLGWSPVTRALLKLKRKSKPEIDENQDGARAMIIEEGIATWIFNHAALRGYYEGVEQGRLEYGLLKQVQNMVVGYEVEKCPLWQWELAILEGFKVFRQLREKGGFVDVDMNTRSIAFRPV